MRAQRARAWERPHTDGRPGVLSSIHEFPPPTPLCIRVCVCVASKSGVGSGSAGTCARTAAGCQVPGVRQEWRGGPDGGTRALPWLAWRVLPAFLTWTRILAASSPHGHSVL
ncbi:hypothetical protein AcW1_008713 [Taiwanofungus camphoratus]|nr:hypothetical protein AcW1_008713 [Antrodia cinnamomea]